MSADERVDREAILARRALFLASTLAALGGCASPARPIADDRVAPAPEASASAREVPPIGERPSSPPKPWRELYGDAPSIAVSGDGLPSTAQKDLGELSGRIETTYEMLALVEQSLPAWCPFERSACEKEWLQFTRELAIVEARVFDMRDRCGGGPDTPYNRLRRAHHRYLSAAVDRVSTLGLTQIESWRAGYNAQQTYLAMWNEAQQAQPRTCLSCVDRDPIDTMPDILFEEGSARIRAASAPILDHARVLIAERAELKLELQGNASLTEGSEKQERALGLRRAEAVKQWLVAHGIDAARLSTVSLGSTRPRAPSLSEEDRALNRSVQLRVVR